MLSGEAEAPSAARTEIPVNLSAEPGTPAQSALRAVGISQAAAFKRAGAELLRFWFLGPLLG